jgi:hypothetical protein
MAGRGAGPTVGPMRTTLRTPRRPTARVAAVIAASVLAPTLAAATATAADRPRVPTVRTVRFKVAVTATQTTTWKLLQPAASRDCSPRIRTEGHGREVVRLRSTRAANATLTTAGRTGVLTIPGNAFGQPAGTSTTAREATVTSRTVPGSCGDNREEPVDRGATDCGTQQRARTWNLRYERGRLTLGAVGEIPAPLTTQEFRTCEVHAADGVLTDDLTEVSTRLPLADLADPAQRKHIVLGRRTWKLRSGSVEGTTTVRWTVTLTRR